MTEFGTVTQVGKAFYWGSNMPISQGTRPLGIWALGMFDPLVQVADPSVVKCFGYLSRNGLTDSNEIWHIW